MKLRVLIVDDEALARSRVRKMLADEPDVELLGECANGPEAVAAIRERQPDLVFLDVQMPEVSGFDVLRTLLPRELPAVIFVTAHDRHAIEAFEVNALDYLLKPFKKERFQAALGRARRHLQRREVATANQRLLQWLDEQKAAASTLTRLAIRTGGRTSFVRIEDVDYIEAAGNYAVIHVGKEKQILRETLTDLESKLPRQRFLRVNRSAIVNLERVKEIETATRGEHLVILKDGQRLPLTRGVTQLRERLQYS